MKRLTLLLLVISLFLTNCDYLRRKGIIGSKKQMLSQIEQLQKTVMDDSLMMEKLKKESQAKIDSIQQSCAKPEGNFHVITGSFRNPANAENFVKEMAKLGYKSQIIQASNGFNLVSAFAGKDMHEACSALNTIRTNVNQESCLYVAN